MRWRESDRSGRRLLQREALGDRALGTHESVVVSSAPRTVTAHDWDDRAARRHAGSWLVDEPSRSTLAIKENEMSHAARTMLTLSMVLGLAISVVGWVAAQQPAAPPQQQIGRASWRDT